MKFNGESISKIIHWVENAFLLFIAVLTVVGAAKEIYGIVGKMDVDLQDLLLMFLYVEVLGMVGAYYDSKQIPITLPIFIAITALARLAILQKEQAPLHLIVEASAILILAVASYVVSLRPARYGLTRDGERVATERQSESGERKAKS